MFALALLGYGHLCVATYYWPELPYTMPLYCIQVFCTMGSTDNTLFIGGWVPTHPPINNV